MLRSLYGSGLSRLGVCKFIGVIVLLIPKYPLVKEWVYSGIACMMAGAIYSHFAANDALSEALPALLLLTLAVISWYFRPAGRKIIFAVK